MHRRRLLTTTVAASALAGLLLAGCGDGNGTSASQSATSSTTAQEPTPGAGAGSAADVSFAQLMIPHHQQAVEMADLALQKAVSSQIRQLAEQIKAAQDPEIATMRAWLSAWGAPEQMPDMEGMTGGHDMGGMTSGMGMMTQEQMQQLQAASGAEFDRMWLTMMIAHHEGAVAMAEEVLAATSSPAVTALATSIVAGQTAEIQTMKGLLAG